MHKTLRLVGYLEALSFLVLLGVAMPLKYLYGMPHATQVPGLLHGLLFMSYVILAREVGMKEKWPRRQQWGAYLSSVLPLGTLVFDLKYLRR